MAKGTSSSTARQPEKSPPKVISKSRQAGIVTILIGALVLLEETFITAKSIDEAFGISSYVTDKVIKEIATKVDSGYSRASRLSAR